MVQNGYFYQMVKGVKPCHDAYQLKGNFLLIIFKHIICMLGIVYGLRVNIELVLNVSELQNENNTQSE